MRKRPGRLLKFYLKLVRNPGTPESIGRGVSAGLFIAFAIPVGHMAVAFPLAMLLRGARSAALLATWVVNPITIPLIYPVQCYLGSFILGNLLSFPEIKQPLLAFLTHPHWSTFCDLGGELIASFFAGGVVLGLLIAVLGYFWTTQMVRHYRARQAQRKKLRTDLTQKTEER